MKLKLPKRARRKFAPQPKILLDGTIPRPLHGVNPRSIKGKAWWDRQRKRAYEHNNYHCHACGVHKRDARIFSWLEAHEIYEVNYEKCTMKFKGVVALCHACHSIVHAGRTTQLYLNGQIDHRRLKLFVTHGEGIFKHYNITPPVAFRFMQLIESGMSTTGAADVVDKEYTTNPLDMRSWNRWKLYFNNKAYPPKYKSHREWSDHYSNWQEGDN